MPPHVPFTDEIGALIVEQLRLGYDNFGKRSQGCTRSISTHVFFDTKWAYEHTYCYAPTTTKFQRCDRDHFGIMYQGYSGKQAHQDIDTEASRAFLSCLLDPSGPFKALLPYMWHTSVDEIIEDRGFVFHSLEKPGAVANAGLLWTFIQASRQLFEHPYKADRLMYLLDKYPENKPLVLLLLFSVQPRVSTRPNDNWAVLIPVHGEPLNRYGKEMAKPFLCGILYERKEHTTHHSYKCWGHPGGEGFLILQVQFNTWTGGETSKGRWTTAWRDAIPEDITDAEEIVGRRPDTVTRGTQPNGFAC